MSSWSDDNFLSLRVEAEDLAADLVLALVQAPGCTPPLPCNHEDDTAKPSHVLNSIR